MVSPREFNLVISKHLYVESFVYVIKKQVSELYSSVCTWNNFKQWPYGSKFYTGFSFSDDILTSNLKFSEVSGDQGLCTSSIS